jgi:hypothetical protein
MQMQQIAQLDYEMRLAGRRRAPNGDVDRALAILSAPL